MTLTEALLGEGALVGHASYVLLVASMMMTRMTWLRVLAVGSGVLSIFYNALWVYDPLSVLWEVLFVATNLAQLALTAYRNSMARFTPEERAFYEIAVPGLAPAQVRRLLKAGRWLDGEAGTVLARQGEPVANLVFLVSGEVAITMDDHVVGSCSAGDFVGEISVSTGIPATASAIAKTPIRYLAFERRFLMQLLNRSGEIGRAVELSFRHGLREKLIRTNMAVVSAARPVI
jgi:CRP-like cAMP-binding protein